MVSSPQKRSLKDLLQVGNMIKILQVHDALSALIVENLRLGESPNQQFDGMWSSSLADSTVRGRPDIECVDLSSRLTTVQDILEVCTKPLIFDGDTGGKAEQFYYTVRTLERVGVAAVVIEDKVGLKRNSLFGTTVPQDQENVEEFCQKVAAGKAALTTSDFMIFARCESLILGKGIDDAIGRCQAYLDAGCDGILIHSCQDEASEILEFARRYTRLPGRKPLAVVPTSFSSVYEKELEAAGINIVIYANHMLRAAYPSMVRVAQSILAHGRCHEASQDCMPIKNILRLIEEPMP
jgi:phosphoenolpyruvate phosphomutase